jgi:ribonuclease R
MLPERLSNGLCSLRPNEPRLTMSVFLELDDAGKVLGSEFAETVIESVRRLTYEEARRLLEEPQGDDRRQYGEVVPALTAMEKISRALTAARRRRGSLEFDLPLADLVLDDQGRLEGVRTGHRNVAHRIIEELMIAANEAVARHLSSHQAGGLYRVHEPPRLEALEELADSLRLFGLDLDVDLASRDPSALRALLVAEEGKPEEALVAGLVLRALQRAIYHPHNDGHYALASESYLHFTSPIRRYPDLVNHRALTRLLREGGAEKSAGARRAARDRPAGRDQRARQKEADKDEVLRLARMAEQSSFTERRAERAERDLKQWKLTRFLAHRVGEEFNGRITGVKEFGLFVLLDEVPVDGLLHVASMGGDFYQYEADHHRLVGRAGGRRFRLGDPIRVRLVAVDERRRSLELALAGSAEPSGGRPGRSKSPAAGRSEPPSRARRGNRGEAAGDKGRRRSGRRR